MTEDHIEIGDLVAYHPHHPYSWIQSNPPCVGETGIVKETFSTWNVNGQPLYVVAGLRNGHWCALPTDLRLLAKGPKDA